MSLRVLVNYGNFRNFRFWKSEHTSTSLGTQTIKLHHEDVVNYLESEGVTIMPHPPNSSDLTPCDFWLFDLIKQNLDDQDDSESLYEAVIKFMMSLKKEEYKRTFDKWIQRMQLCINNQGDYFD